MELYEKIVINIIKQQESLIGPVAVERAKTVSGLDVDWKEKTVKITGEPKATIDQLVEQYRLLFGQISVEVCKEAAGVMLTQISPDELPSSLK